MPYRPLTKVTARWLALEGAGMEHLTLERHDDRITAMAVVSGGINAAAFGAHYNIFLDCDWNVKAVSVFRTDSVWFVWHSRTPGHWTDADGRHLPEFDGCTDIDLSATPFTNTTAIRRLALGKGETADIETVFLPFDTLEPARARQRYTCIEPGRRYTYESLTTGYRTELTTDSDGLLTDYPGLFKRLT